MNSPKINIRARQPTANVSIQVTGTGKDGYTPQKGVDYWTEDDKAEILSDVDRLAKEAVDGYLSENPPAPQITINGQPPDENNNFELKIESGEINNVIEF